MNEIQKFASEKFGEIRTVTIDDEPWFVGKDVALALGYVDATKAARERVDEEDRGVAEIDTPSGIQQMTIINESGLYALILSSRLESAREFKRWVTSEVLPSIRKQGGYIAGQKELSPEELMAKALMVAKQTLADREAMISALTVENQIMQPKADYFDELVDRNLLTNLRETAKQLEVREKAFICFLLNRKYLYRDGRGRLMPYAQHVESGLFSIKETFNEKTSWSGTQTLVTPKGRETFRLLMLKGAAS